MKSMFFFHIDAVDPNILFAQVDISDICLSFLDCLVTIDTDRTLSIAVFQNGIHTDQYLNFQSSHPLHQKLWLDKTVSQG